MWQSPPRRTSDGPDETPRSLAMVNDSPHPRDGRSSQQAKDGLVLTPDTNTTAEGDVSRHVGVAGFDREATLADFGYIGPAPTGLTALARQMRDPRTVPAEDVARCAVGVDA